VKLPGEEGPRASALVRDEEAERVFEERAAGAPPIEAAAIATEIAEKQMGDAQPPPPTLRHRPT
jgi:hypothetical protein